MVRAFFKLVCQGLAIEVEILTLFEGLFKPKSLNLSNLLVEGDYATFISWTIKKEREPSKLDELLCQIIDISLELQCLFPWDANLHNHVIDVLVKHGARFPFVFQCNEMRPMEV